MIKDLSINEKIGQMIIVRMNGNKIDKKLKTLIKKYKISGVILYKKNFQNYEEMIKIISELKKLNSKNKAPLFIAIDQEGGRVNRMPKEFHFLLSALRLAGTKNINAVKEAAEITGEMLNKSGYNMNFAPVLDVLSKNTSDSIGNRSFGKNAEDVSKYGVETMKQLQKHNIIPVIKHFPGQGKAKVDSHFLLPTLKQIDKEDIKPFEDAIKSDADALMVGHIRIKSVSKLYPASLSRTMIKQIRLKYNFKGVIVSDALKMRAIKYIYGTKRAFRKAIFAGNDLILVTYGYREDIDSIKSFIKLVKKGKIKERRIDYSVNRILKLKEKYNLNDNSEIEKCNIEEINNRIDLINEYIKECEEKNKKG